MQPVRFGSAVSSLAISALLGTLALAPLSCAQKIETSQEVNDRIRSLATTSHSAPPPPRDYVIGSGDVVSIQVFDVPELSRDLRVSQTGTIGIPLVPVRLHVAGLTEIQAERKIQEVLEANGLVSHPEVSVAVREKKSKPIAIVGAVEHPQIFQADRQVTLIEVLAEAGGISPSAGDTVIVTRPSPEAQTDATDPAEPPPIGPEDTAAPKGVDIAPPSAKATTGASDSKPTDPAQPAATNSAAVADSAKPAAGSPDASVPVPPPLNTTITVNLNQLLETGDTSNNIIVLPGDVVTVPHAGIVYVLGAVARPGGFVVTGDRQQLTTLKVLSLAGGLNRTAKSDHAVIVRKDDGGQQHNVDVDLKKVMKFQSEDLQLRPSDILYVPNSGAKQALVRTGELALAVGAGVIVYRLIP
jgi:polysaccharide biosynthesis/export protein